MAGRGRPPADERVRRNIPTHGEPVPAEHTRYPDDTPAPPDGLMPAALEAWNTWFDSWFASFWRSSDLPGLRHLIRLYDQVERGEFQRSAELRMTMDTYGITPKGQQDRRWKPPITGAPADGGVAPKPGKRYEHLRAVN